MEGTEEEALGGAFTEKQERSTRIALQNVGRQPLHKHSIRPASGAAAMLNGQYDIMLFAEHGMYPPRIEQGQPWHHRMQLQV